MSMSLMAVFIPLLFMGGLIGRLFHEFAVTVSLAILVSGVHLADAHADDVLALSASRKPAMARRAHSAAPASGRSTGCSAITKPA